MNDKSESIERWMVCDTCSLQGKVGYFKEMGVNFKSTNDLQVCNNDHLLKEKHKTTNPSPPFWKTMVIFLKDGIEKHPKMPFSQVFQMIKDGKLKGFERRGADLDLQRCHHNTLQPCRRPNAIRSCGSLHWRED